MSRYLATQTDKELAEECRRRSKPWTTSDYEAVRSAALALVRTHTPWDRADGTVRPSFDGPSYWALLGALDRASGHSPLARQRSP